MRDEGMKERSKGGREEMMQRRSDGPRERGMEGLRDYTEREGRRRERQRGIVLCGSPQSLFALVAAATARVEG